MSERCYSKRLPATRQQQQQEQQEQQQEQQSRPGGGQDSRQGSRPGPRKPNPLPQKPANAGHASEPSSMGTESDDAVAQVKQLADPAFGSLSTPPPPPLDYLDVRDASGRPSADGSQASADENSASAASTWYAELDVSAESDSDEDGLSHLRSTDTHDNDNDGEGFGAGGFECVDVALESGGEEAGRGVGPKTVPKRQIHLRRCSTEESLVAVSGGFRAGTPPQCQGNPKALLCRQYSTPATIQGGSQEASPKSPHSNRKQRLQKSLSLDETSSRTKMASSLIKNVLSKKMQFELKIQQQKPEEEAFSQSCPVREIPKTRVGKLPPGIRLGRSLSQEVPPCPAEPDPQGGPVHQHGSFSTKSHQEPLDEHSLSALQGCGGRPGEPLSRGTGRSKTQLSRRENPAGLETQLAGSKAGGREQRSGDSAKTSAGSAASTWVGAAGRAEGECQASPRNGKQLSAGSRLPSEPPQTALAPWMREEKRASDECLPKNVGEIGVTAAVEAVRPLSGVVLEAREMLGGGGEMGNREDSRRGQTVAPLHRVRDMRKLVKSTYSSPFSFSGASGEQHPGNNTAAPPRLSAQKPPGGAGETAPAIAAPAVPEPGVREARVPPVVQKPLAKGTSAKKPTVTAGYSQRLAEVMTTPSYLTAPMSGYKEQPQKGGGAAVSPYRQQQAPAVGAAAPTRSRLPTATATPSYKMPRHDLTCCPSEGAPTGGLQENFGLPATRSQDRYPPSSVRPVQSRAKDSHRAQTPPSLHPHGSLSYQAASFNGKNPNPMQTSALRTCPAPLLLPRPKDTQHPLPDQARDGHGTLQNPPPEPSELAWGKPGRGRSRSPHRPPPDAQAPYPCGPGGPPVPFAPELEGPEVGTGKVPYLPGGGALLFGQNPRRLLLDPETGTCFYVEMPAQPRRKVLFDPESGQYMEVLVPPQAMYPPSINPCPYPYLPSPGIYPPQYLPYSMLSMPQGP